MSKWWADNFVAFWQSVPDHPLPFVSYLLGALAAAWAGWPASYPILVWCMVADMITGILAGRRKSVGVTREVAWGGIRKKAIVLIMCGLGDVVSHPAHVPFNIGATLAGFYAAYEGISILENAKRAGLPVPPYLLKALNKAAALADIEAAEALEAAHHSTAAARESLKASRDAEKKIETAIVAEKGPDA